jgi:multiple sugar transport system permease protein
MSTDTSPVPTGTAARPSADTSADPAVDARAVRRLERRKRSLRPSHVAVLAGKTLATVVIVLLALFPLAWMVISGFKSRTEVVKTPFQFFPEVWHPENYVNILSDPAFMRTLLVTGLGAVLFTTGSILVNSMAAYAFARLEFVGKRFVWPIVLTTMFIPGMTILLTSFIVVTKLYMLDTLAVLVLPGLAAAAHIFFVRQFYLNIPSSLEEAARVDGCGRWGVYLRIFIPLSKAPFVVVGITSFMAFWNSFVWPVLTITNPNLYMVQQYLANFRGERASELGMLMAGSACAAAPVIILFLLFQRQIIANIKMAGLK